MKIYIYIYKLCRRVRYNSTENNCITVKAEKSYILYNANKEIFYEKTKVCVQNNSRLNSTTIINLLALLSLLDDLSGDDHSLDLRRAFVYLVNLGIAHQFFYGIFRVETIASEDLNGIRCDFIGNIGSVAFSD